MLKTIISTLCFGIFITSNSVVAAPTLSLEERYEQYLYSWVDSLAVCESGQNPSALNPQDGGSASIGYVQFKVATFTWQVDVLGLDYTDEDIWDREAQRHLAVEMVKDKTTNWKHWYNCHTKYGVEKPTGYTQWLSEKV